MPRSEPRPEVTLDFLVSLLDPERLRREIDAPLDAATQAFLARSHRARSTPEFNRAITRFVRTIHARAVGFRRVLSTAEAYAIAVDALDRAYDPAGSHGYLLALVVVVKDGQEPLESVLLAITDGIKQTEPDKYRSWVYVWHVQAMTWAQKCALAAEVLRHPLQAAYAHLLPSDAAMLATRLPELIDAHIKSLAALRELLPSIVPRP